MDSDSSITHASRRRKTYAVTRFELPEKIPYAILEQNGKGAMDSVDASKQRGLSDHQIKLMASDKRLKKVLEREDIFLGIRNGYFNLYFQGASAGKFEFARRGGFRIETALKYSKGAGKKLSQELFFERFEEILANIDKHQKSDSDKGWVEKNVQQALILANNRNPNSAWFCVDMEYSQQRQNKNMPGYGRADIVAISRNPGGDGRYRAALIEVKFDAGAYGGSPSPKVREQLESGTFSIDRCDETLGSGIVGHLADFYRFEKAGQFRTLQEEICQILSNKKDLELPVPFEHKLRPRDIEDQPHFYFLTLCSDMASCKKRMRNYLGAAGCSHESAYSARKLLGSDFLDRENYHFLFAPEAFSGRASIDILDGAGLETL